MKREYGTGVSTKIILFNDTPEDMFYSGSDSWSGRWQVSPPEKIPAGKYAAFLHVKTTGTVRGSWGYAEFRTESREKMWIGWSTPWCWACILYNNRIGVEVAPAGHHPENIENIPTQARHFRTSDPLETTIRGEAEMKEDKYSTLVLYTCVQIG